MRQVESTQAELGGTFISEVRINPKSRDDIPVLLRGLQQIYQKRSVRVKVFEFLSTQLHAKVRHDTGRPGMDWWRILVLATLKQGLNCDYDRLAELANEHGPLRQMLGHGIMPHDYNRQTVADNVRLLTPQLLDEISRLVVCEGHQAAGKKPDAALHGRADSFCVETNVRYPTDLGLLWDSTRCLIRISASLADARGVKGWRHWQYWMRETKRHYNNVRNSKRRGRSPTCIKRYLSVCEMLVQRAEHTLEQVSGSELPFADVLKVKQLEELIEHARRFSDQVRRRLLDGEKIPHKEKVFSIFEPHTRWISKGKAGCTQELGVPVCVVEDQYRFVLHHQIMWDGTDVDYAVSAVSQTQQRFADFSACSFDKGFHSVPNQAQLAEQLEQCALPRKGRLSVAAAEHEAQDWFKAARKQHPAIESKINCLEHCGLDRVLDHGKEGFARAVSLSVLSANLKRLGTLLRDKERKSLARRQRLRAA